MKGDLIDLRVRTRHPQDYLLVNEQDGTYWRGTTEGHWIAHGVVPVLTTIGVIAWLEGLAANTDTDPRWLAAQELRRLPSAGDK